MSSIRKIGLRGHSLMGLVVGAWMIAGVGCSNNGPARTGTGGRAGSGSGATGGGGGGGRGGISGSGGSGTGGATGVGSGGNTGTGGRAGAETGGVGVIATGGSGTGGVGGGGIAGNGGAAGVGGAGGSCPDSDLDGMSDCVDGCPTDFLKVAAGACGCGNPDTDSDGDGTADCVDLCPQDMAKIQGGACGCGVPDVDTDGDLTLDCNDGCPKDNARTTRGICGCGGIPDTTPLCLVHRYSFGGTGTTVTDSITIAGVNPASGVVSPANGTAVNVTLPGTGSIVLQGVSSDQYVSLPAGIVSSLGNSATIETWVTWTGIGGQWQRIFDFGSSDAAAGMQGTGRQYLFVTPLAASSTLRAAFTVGGVGGEAQVNGPGVLPATVMAHVAVVVDGTTNFMSLYLNGQFLGQLTLPTARLSALNDVNNWLGRSQFAPDPEFSGSITEVRIYGSARTATEMMASFTAGPDALPPN